MPRNQVSEQRKKHMVSLLERRLGPLYRGHSRRRDWYSSKQDAVDVFITDSKAHYSRRPWFDMKDEDLEELANHPAGFIVFILGDEDCYLVVPARELAEQLPHHREGLLETGFYHFNLPLGRCSFEQLPTWDLSQYLGRISLIPDTQSGKRISHELRPIEKWCGGSIDTLSVSR